MLRPNRSARVSSVLAPSTAEPPRATEFANAVAGRAKAAAGRLLGLSLPRFLAVGCIGLTTDVTMFSLASAGGVSDALARSASLAIATLVTWRLNRRFTFAASGRRAPAEVARYVAVALGAQGFNLALFLAIRSFAPALPALLALGASGAMAAVASFAGQSLITFRGRLSGAAPAFFGARP